MNDDGYTISKEELQRYLALEARVAELYNENQALKQDTQVLFDDYTKLLPEATAAEARVAELERVLRMVEFIYFKNDRCPWCDGVRPDYPYPAISKGHAPDCPRQKVLNE